MSDVPDSDDPMRLERCIYVRRHGDGFSVSVEPHPVGDSLNRRCATYAAAMSWAAGTRRQKGWTIVDEAAPERSQVHRDPAPQYGRGKVHVNEHGGGSWSVTVSPRRWGWGDADKQFFCPRRAAAYADQLRDRIRIEEAKRTQRRARNRRVR